MQGKTISDSEVVITHVIGPPDVNIAGNVPGGTIMKLIDTAAGVAATRHARTNCITASIDRIDFRYPVYSGDIVTCKASLNLAGKSSMEVGVRVESENLYTGEVRHTASAYITYVALDKSGRPTQIPPLILQTEEEKRRNREALARRDIRMEEKNGDNKG